MKKVELALPVNEWSTLKSKYAPDIKQVLTDEFTRGTINIDTQTKGAITKRKGAVTYNPTALALAFKDQYEAIFSDGVRHTLAVQSGEVKYTSGDRIFNTIENGTGFAPESNFEFEITQDRVYGGNGANDPIVYDRTTNYGGVVYTAPRIRNMGVQAPLTAPSVAVVAGGSVPVGGHTYKITYLYYDFEESNGGPASAVATTSAGNQQVDLTSVPVGGYGVTARKVYRDNNDGVYVLVGTIANNTATTFSDTVAAGTTPIPLDNGLPPTFGQIVLFLDSLFIADVPGQPSIVYYSQTGFPDIFPEANFIICNQKDPITALIVYQDRIIVFNRRSMGQILGRTPDQFRYSHIPGSVGCVDNRTIQTRTIDGVPVLVWLSDKGFYMYNGNSITYISEDIEDQVNVNIQQANYQKGSHTDDSQQDFEDGTSTQGIDLDSIPGAILTKGYLDGSSTPGNNPRRSWDDSNDWEGGSSVANIRTRAGDNKLYNPRITGWTPSAGSLNGVVVSNPGDGEHIKLPTVTTLGGESIGAQPTSGALTFTGLAIKFVPSVSGTISSGVISGFTNPAFTYAIYSHDSGTDKPNVSLGVIPSVAVTAGTTYWLVLELSTSTPLQQGGTGFPSASGNKTGRRSGGFWFTNTFGYGTSSYTITTTPQALTGNWTSVITDSQSLAPTPLSLYLKGVYPSGTSGTFTLETSDDPLFSVVAATQVFSNPNGIIAASLGGHRYWRARLTLSTTNNLNVPDVGGTVASFTSSFVLEFSRTTTWISEAIDCTSDVTVYNSLDTILQNFGGSVTTTVTVTVSSSADDITYPDGFVPFGSVVVRRYLKVRIVMTSGNVGGAAPIYHILSPNVTSSILKWTVVSTLESASIDTTAVPPAGWSIFQASDTLNGGTIQYYMRSADSLVNLAAATYFLVTPEQLPPPTVVPLQYAQWKVVITSTDLHVPQVDSVTIRWLLSTNQSLRAASIFVDRRYFVAVATIGSSTNNTVFELDVNNKWRVHDGLQISTMGYFFNEPYYGSAVIGKMFKFLEGFLDDETENIAIDIRTKAFDFSDRYSDSSDMYKTIQEVILNGVGTGADYTVQYSVDNGMTFITIPNEDGTSSYLSLNDGKRFSTRFRVNFAYGNVVSGKTLMIRITTDDAFDIQIHQLKVRAWVRNQH